MGQPVGAPSLEALLPTQGAADRLIQQYFDAVHPIVRCVHRPSFEAGYQEFWTHVFENIEPRPSLQALVFAAMFSGAVSMDDATAQREFGKSQKDLYEMLKLGTETALSKANFLRTTRVETLQAFVMYLVCGLGRLFTMKCYLSQFSSPSAATNSRVPIQCLLALPSAWLSVWAFIAMVRPMALTPSTPMFAVSSGINFASLTFVHAKPTAHGQPSAVTIMRPNSP